MNELVSTNKSFINYILITPTGVEIYLKAFLTQIANC